MRESVDLNLAFFPQSVVIAGASNNIKSSGYSFLSNMVKGGYRGKIYPVAPGATEVLGLKGYSRITDIPGPVDYVISCVPAAALLDVLNDCGAKGVRIVHLFTARLAETGDREAIELENRMLETARRFGMRLIGPNCMGVYCPGSGISFMGDVPMRKGNVGGFAQSGGNASMLVRCGILRGITYSKMVSYGNAVDVNEVDFLDYYRDDPETEVISAYIEGVKEPAAFLEALRRTTPRKPVVILKGGWGAAGAGATYSHTAALAGSYPVWLAALRQAGAVAVRTLEEMMDVVLAFAKLPEITGTRAGVMGGGGGMAVVSADQWEDAGFTQPPLPENIMRRVRDSLPKTWWNWVRNPLDISIIPPEKRTGALTTELMRMMGESGAFDFLVGNLSPPGSSPGTLGLVDMVMQQTQDLIDTAKIGKPMVAVINTGVLGGPDLKEGLWMGLAEVNGRLISAGVPVYRNPSEAAYAVRHLVNYYRWREGVKGDPS